MAEHSSATSATLATKRASSELLAAAERDPRHIPAMPTEQMPDQQPETYPTFDGDLPWSQRSWWYELKPLRGMIYDLRRRAPFYARDWTEAAKPANWLTIADSVVRMYFIK